MSCCSVNTCPLSVPDGPRPTRDEIVKLRSFMLLYLRELIVKGQGILEDELQSMLNYLTTLHEVQLVFLTQSHKLVAAPLCILEPSLLKSVVQKAALSSADTSC